MSLRLSGRTSGRSLMWLMRRFAAARSGNVAIITALMLTPMMGVASLAVDYAYVVKGQGKLDQIALIAATNASNSARDILNAAGSGSNSLDDSAVAEGKLVAETFFDAQTPSVTNTSVTGRTVTVQRIGNVIQAKVTYNATVTTLIARVVGVSTITIAGGGSMIVSMMDLPQSPGAQGMVLDERWGLPAGTSPQLANANLPIINDWFSGTPGTASPLTGPPIQTSSGAVSTAPTLRVGSPDGSIPPLVSKKVYLEKGFYELRYWYKSTIVYSEYDPVFICGTIEREMNWVNSWLIKTGSRTNNSYLNTQTARAGVYLNAIVGNPQTSSIPTLGDFRMPPYVVTPAAGTGDPYTYHSRVDICAYSSKWIQRSVNIEITQTGYFWLNFVSEPAQSSGGTTRNGFYLGPVQLCKGAQSAVDTATACPGALNNNWPWPANTTLYKDTFDEAPQPAVGANFITTRNIFPASSLYDRTPDWILGRFGGSFTPAGFQYKKDPANASNTIVRSTELGMWAYRRMLLMPGLYKFKFKASANESLPRLDWCPSNTDPLPTAPVLRRTRDGAWILLDQRAGTTCTCPAGYITTTISSDELQLGQSNRFTTGTAPAIYSGGSGSDSPIILSDCHVGSPTSRTNGDVYCALIPRTQYYGFRIAVSGPTLTQAILNADSAFNGYDTQLNTGGAFFDGLEVTLLSPGVKNNKFGTIADPGDFFRFDPDCVSGLGTYAGSRIPTSANVMTGGIPMWPGYSAVALNRLKVTASRF